MTNFVAIYRGKTADTAKVVAVCANPAIVAGVAGQLLELSPVGDENDPTLAALADGRRKALTMIASGKP